MCGNLIVRSWIPYFVINAVRDTDQPIRPLPRQPIEAIAVLRRLNFERITPRNRRESVRHRQPGLHRRRRTIRQKSIPLELAAKAELPQLVFTKNALVSHIVDRENRSCVSPICVPSTPRSDLGGCKTAVPIVQVNNIGSIADPLQKH